MAGLVLILVLGALSFAAGYGTREFVSRQRREKFLKFRPYLPPAEFRQPPAFLLRGRNLASRSTH